MKLEKRVKNQVVIRGRILKEDVEKLLLAFFTYFPEPDDRIVLLRCELIRCIDTRWVWGKPSFSVRILGDLEQTLEVIESDFNINRSLDDQQCLIDSSPWTGEVATSNPMLLQLFWYIRGCLFTVQSNQTQVDRRQGISVLDDRLLHYLVEQNKEVFEAMGVPPLK
ncbi:MAG: hypothetical protein AAB632_01140 [Patescibacteria group bacterium]